MKKTLIFIIVIVVFACACFAVGCVDKQFEYATYCKSNFTAGEFGILDDTNNIAEITFSTGDVVRVELYKSVAPISVENFVKLAKSGFYEGTVMHRIIKEFMIQGGGFEMKDGNIVNKESPYGSIKGEFSENGVTNKISHKKGVISMARTSEVDSATSQFFICADIPANSTGALDGKYAAFGRVIDEESMESVIKLSEVETHASEFIHSTYGRQSASDVPVKVIRIKSVKIY